MPNTSETRSNDESSRSQARVMAKIRDLQELLQVPPASGADFYTTLIDLLDAMERELDRMSTDSMKLDVVAYHAFRGLGGFANTALARELRTRGRTVSRNEKLLRILQSVA